jgi:glycine/D-amino acid oxidase-like deaminating enzyme
VTGDRTTIIVTGGGVFGITAALELRRRGWSVRLFDGARPPSPVASSTDISKAVRMDYGDDGFYTELAELALERWRSWNESFGETVYHEVGFLVMTPRSMEHGGFEYDCFRSLRRRGQHPERIDATTLAQRFPAWAAAPYADGYFNPRAGWTPSGRVVALLADQATAAGVSIECRTVTEILTRAGRVRGVRTASGRPQLADHVLVAAGAWTSRLVPGLEHHLRAIGQPVVRLKPRDTEPFAARRFPVWAADIANTGWYGFPVTLDDHVKVANHGPGRPIEPGQPLEVQRDEVERVREFLADRCPALADAPLAASRLCLYCDTADGDFWIDHDPVIEGLIVAAGGSGHGFKFAPVLGPIIADVVERRPNRWASRFRARRPGADRQEAARGRG